MVEVRYVTHALCRILNAVVNIEEQCSIRAEDLRLAKFNKADDNSIFRLWNVLHKLCCKENDNHQCSDKSTEMVNCVKLCFASALYDNFALYSLPTDMSYGSRELLLALGWLVAEINIVEIKVFEYVKKNVVKIEDYSCRKNDLSGDHSAYYNFETNPEDLSDLLNFLIWLAGRLEHNIKSISSMVSERSNLIAKVQNVVEDEYGVRFLSIEEIKTLQNSGEVHVITAELKKVISILDSYLYYVKKSDVFWDWMESVVAEDIGSELIITSCGEDICKFIELLMKQIKIKIMIDRSQDSSKFKDMLELNYLSKHNNVNEILDWLSKMDGRIGNLNDKIKNKMIVITEILQVLKSKLSGKQ